MAVTTEEQMIDPEGLSSKLECPPLQRTLVHNGWDGNVSEEYTQSFIRHQRAVYDVIRHIHRHLDEEQSLQRFAEIADCSIWHLDRVFLRMMKMSPMSFLAAIRIEAAKRLLVTTDEKIINICYDVGYNSLGSFGKRFTRMVGMSPRELRSASKTFDPLRFRDMFSLALVASNRTDKDLVSVAVELPPQLAKTALVFVGLFRTEIPSIQPAACSQRQGSGVVYMQKPRPGNYRCLAVAFPKDADHMDLILQDNTLRGSSNCIEVTPNAHPLKLRIKLHDPSALEAPLIPVFPLMLMQSNGKPEGLGR